MKFICDVHISFKLVKHLNSLGFQTFHVNELVKKWYTTDNEISSYADTHDLILITKDSDFKNSFLVRQTPRKLLKVNLGNISNEMLIQIITENLDAIRTINESERFLIEIDRDSIVFLTAPQ